MKYSGMQSERKRWAFVITQVIGAKMGKDATTLLNYKKEEPFSEEEWDDLKTIRQQFFITECDRQIYPLLLSLIDNMTVEGGALIQYWAVRKSSCFLRRKRMKDLVDFRRDDPKSIRSD